MWEKIINDFVAKRFRDRMLFFAHSEKRQSDLYRELLHVPAAFDAECIVTIPPNKQNTDDVVDLMQQMGASDRCWVYSIAVEDDAKIISLKDALEQVFGQCIETILYFENQGLAYYEGGHCDRLILKKRRR